VYYDDEQDYIPWSRPAARTHPVLAALLVAALAIVAWRGLVSYLHTHRAGAARAVPGPITMQPAAPPVSGRPRGQALPARSQAASATASAESASGTRDGRRKGDSAATLTDTASTVLATRAFAGRAVSAGGSSSAPFPATAEAAQSTGPAKARVRHDSTTSRAVAAADSGVGNVSPFRRTHPWAAVPGQRYYFPSNCPSTLRLRDLVFFRTERRARAEGFERSPSVECQ